jgi:hypothetical protein
VNAAKRRWLTGLWVKRGRVRDTSNFAYAKRKCISDFFGEWGGVGFGGVYGFVSGV